MKDINVKMELSQTFIFWRKKLKNKLMYGDGGTEKDHWV
jgi:hypothetical protein